VVNARGVVRGSTSLNPRNVLTQTAFHWLLQLELPGLRSISETDVFDPMVRADEPGVLVCAEDGNHAQVPCAKDNDGRYRVIQGGGNWGLWDTIKTAYAGWLHLGQPDARRFGIVANPTVQFAWLDDENGWLRWPLPLTGENNGRGTMCR
jgi:hypothetical protein